MARETSRAPLLAFAALAAIPLSIAFLDRPIARFMFEHLHQQRGPFVLMTRLVDVVELAASLLLLWSLWNFWRGGRLGGFAEAALRWSLAVFATLGVKELLKLAFGRTWPETFTCGNPSFIRDAAFGFTPFHGGQGWASFPSGHTAVICAAAACLWAMAPRGRPLWVAAAMAVSIGLLAADYHWLSDIFGGALVGWTLGLLLARVDLPADRS
jgi:membrane-associated phospholipid phosphatase